MKTIRVLPLYGENIEKTTVIEESFLQNVISGINNNDIDLKKIKTVKVIHNNSMYRVPQRITNNMYSWKTTKNKPEAVIVSDLIYTRQLTYCFYKAENIDGYDELYVSWGGYTQRLIKEHLEKNYSLPKNIRKLIDHEGRDNVLEKGLKSETYYYQSGLYFQKFTEFVKEIKLCLDEGIPVFTPCYLYKVDDNYKALDDASVLLNLNLPATAIQHQLHPSQFGDELYKNRTYVKKNQGTQLVSYFNKIHGHVGKHVLDGILSKKLNEKVQNSEQSDI